jgi:hypothetical protein
VDDRLCEQASPVAVANATTVVCVAGPAHVPLESSVVPIEALEVEEALVVLEIDAILRRSPLLTSARLLWGLVLGHGDLRPRLGLGDGFRGVDGEVDAIPQRERLVGRNVRRGDAALACPRQLAEEAPEHERVHGAEESLAGVGVASLQDEPIACPGCARDVAVDPVPNVRGYTGERLL